MSATIRSNATDPTGMVGCGSRTGTNACSGSSGVQAHGDHRNEQSHMVEITSKNPDGSVSVQRYMVTINQIAGEGEVNEYGEIELLTQRTDDNEPAYVSEGMKRSLFDFGDTEGQPVQITSGIRTPEQNHAVCGAPDSSDLIHQAADIRILGYIDTQTARAANRSGEFYRVSEYTDGRGVHVNMKATGNQGLFMDWVHQPQ